MTEHCVVKRSVFVLTQYLKGFPGKVVFKGILGRFRKNNYESNHAATTTSDLLSHALLKTNFLREPF